MVPEGPRPDAEPGDAPALVLGFAAGTLRLEGWPETEVEAADGSALPPALRWDPRERVHRAPASAYADVVRWLRGRQLDFDDRARAYQELAAEFMVRHAPHDFQREALKAWERGRSRGVVVLPTGAGKTFVATLAIDARRRSTLVVVPTLDLQTQWYDVLRAAFATPIGLVGGGYHEVQPITVTTYDSAHLHMERLGNRFGLVIFDECHHLPSDAYALAARMCLAPFRLGLTATPERADGRTSDDLVGPIVYRKDVTELSGDYLSSYETVRLDVPLSADERAAYEAARGEYLAFLRKHAIRMSAPDGWSRFLIMSSRTDEGRRAFAAYRRQRALALAAPGKITLLSRLLHAHKRDRVIVFTEDNATVYHISRRFLVPAITHQTKVKERSAILAGLADGSLGAVVTSKVLNEGVDVPDANVAVVLSGSGSVREHVQRLGRVLRKREGKHALLYELVASGTGEEHVSQKRRDHVAYH